MKKFIRFTLVFAFLFLIGTGVWAADYNVYKLDDGQTVIIKQVKNNPIVNIDTWVKTGSINENDENNGVSHFLEHLFFKGTQAHPTGEFDKILESKGAVTNAATSKDFTHYYITIPSKDFDTAMDLHADMLLNPMIPRKELEKERKVVMEEIAKNENNPSNEVYNNFNDMMYTTHPYRRRVLGSNKIIGTITREEILNYYKTHYGPQDMITIVIGDVDPGHALEKIKEDFKTSDVRKLIHNINQPVKPLTFQHQKTVYDDTTSGYMIIGYRGVNALNCDTYALDVLATILGEGRSSILYQSIKEQKDLAFSISADNSTYKEDGLFMISANFTPDKTEKLENAIYEEIAKIQKHGVTKEQLQKAKNIIQQDTHYSRESISNISEEIGYTTVLTDNPKYYDEYLNNVKKVTAFDVKRAADKYLSKNKSAVSILLPKTAEVSAKSANVQAPPQKPALVSQNLFTKKYLLSDGSTLLITPNDLNDIVAISINAKGGNFIENIPGTGELTSATMLRGTQNYTLDDLAKVMEENGIKISPSASSDSFDINVLTTRENLNKTLDLLDEIVNRATFDDYQIEKARTSMLESIQKSRDLPLNRALEEYRTLIFENSVYSNSSKIIEKTLPKIKKSDILSYYQKIFNPKNIVISVNGNVDVNDVSDKLTEIFENKNNSNVFDYSQYKDSIPPITSPRNSVVQVENLKACWLIMGWQTAGLLNQKDYATLEVIDSILGSGMSSRLFKNIRDQEGLAYQLGSSYSPHILRGAFTVYIGTNPKTLDLAKAKMLIEVNRLKTEFVSDKELKEAKDKLTGNFILSQETNLEKASTIGWFEASGRGYDFKNKYQDLINSVTANDIIEVANKYFGSNFVTSVVEGK